MIGQEKNKPELAFKLYEPVRRVYIAGPMTGLPEFNYPAFNACAADLRAKGFLCTEWGAMIRCSRMATKANVSPITVSVIFSI